ncbi:MAG: prepilin-type N-terminal cleavage/methylation domain-containing protein [Candidatus Sulfotelmatobacter sp.]
MGNELQTIRRRAKGFTLLEMMISMGIGLIILGSGLQIYTQCVRATFTTSQRSEMQQDFRAAGNLLQRDISMAGSGALGQQGLASNSVGLASGVGSTVPVYPCNAITCNYINAAPVAYPTSAGVPYLYSIIPGYNFGITVNAAEGPTDIITVAYADATLPLNCYTVDVVNATTIIFELPTPLPGTCVLPYGVPVVPANIPALNAAGIGLQTGDYILFGQSTAGVVTAVTPAAVTSGAYSVAYQVTFNNGDPGHIDQPAIANGTMKSFPVGISTTLSAVRLLVITYYLDISPIDGVTPRLMRIQNGRSPAPVAEGVSCLKFSYDVDNSGTIVANQATLPAGVTPAMITKVNILHMSIRSQLKGTTGYQSLDLQTSVSARNLTMGQEYPISGSAY